ncbi:hydrogenase nickel incorporation protein HypB [Pluralibacter sp.]|uniref:hydrogenase nickel incorporation protein HypB n=1 Tax=Pluralibacter sp. TaxID=1920032 RepID=UPI0025E2F32C|nr:hydrogenase nickel incorporation protein HypB [Pluralibacter sp.]MBV8042402.1 hydrogenase nickel incorporation protein HypB [Pluralibacter sp.]
MCTTCGCASGERHIEGDEHHHHEHEHEHHHGHHHHEHGHHAPAAVIIHHHHHYSHHGDVHHHYAAPGEAAQFTPLVQPETQDLHYGHGEAGSHAPGMGQRRLLQIEQDVLSENNRQAAHNREHFAAQRILALNLVSSPGSGKTTLLTATLQHLASQRLCAVIEGDQQTSNDARRIRATGVPAIQVNTGKGCHLDAQMVHEAAHRLDLQDNSLLFIENVGNLVCPASFDLGERHKIAVLSVTEGEDKPLKYPHMFAAATLMIVNKIDLLPYVDFSVEQCVAAARQVNPAIEVITLSATSGEGMDRWLAWLEAQ